MDKVDVLAVMEEEMDRRLTNYNAAAIGEAPEALVDRLHVELHEMATARAAVAELIEAADGVDATHGPMLNPRAVTPKQRQLALNRLRVALARVKAD